VKRIKCRENQFVFKGLSALKKSMRVRSSFLKALGKGFVVLMSVAVLGLVLFITCMTEVQYEWLDVDAGPEFGNVTQPLLEGEKIEQYFVADRSVIQSISVRALTWDRAYAQEDTVSIRIVELETGDTIAQRDMKLSEFKNNELTELPFEGIKLKKDAQYSLEFVGRARSEEESISLMYSDIAVSAGTYCQPEMGYNLSIRIIGTGMF